MGNFVFTFLVDLFDPQDKIDLFKVNFNLHVFANRIGKCINAQSMFSIQTCWNKLCYIYIGVQTCGTWQWLQFRTSVAFYLKGYYTKMCIGTYLKEEKFIPKICLVCGRIISLQSTEKLLNCIVQMYIYTCSTYMTHIQKQLFISVYTVVALVSRR